MLQHDSPNTPPQGGPRSSDGEDLIIVSNQSLFSRGQSRKQYSHKKLSPEIRHMSPEHESKMEKRVLIVDDEPSMLKMLNSLFSSFGYTPYSASSGDEALELLKKHAIRVVWTDLRMPLMDGMTLCRKVKAIDKSAHVYALSAYIGAFTPEQFKEAGFDGYFEKPFELERLIETCNEAFEILDKLE